MASAAYDYTIQSPRTTFDPLAAARSSLTATTASLKQQTPNYIAGKESYEHIRSLNDLPLTNYQSFDQLPSSQVQNLQPLKNKGFIDRGTVNLANTVFGQSPQVVSLEGDMIANQDRDNVKIATVQTGDYYLNDPGIDSVNGQWRSGFAQNANQKLNTRWSLKAPLPGQIVENSQQRWDPLDSAWTNGRQHLATIMGPGIDSRRMTSTRRVCY